MGRDDIYTLTLYRRVEDNIGPPDELINNSHFTFINVTMFLRGTFSFSPLVLGFTFGSTPLTLRVPTEFEVKRSFTGRSSVYNIYCLSFILSHSLYPYHQVRPTPQTYRSITTYGRGPRTFSFLNSVLGGTWHFWKTPTSLHLRVPYSLWSEMWLCVPSPSRMAEIKYRIPFIHEEIPWHIRIS